jgi:hypothetical protein
MEKIFEDAKVGDRVWSFVRGWGKIVSVDHSIVHPIVAMFPKYGVKAYDLDGKYYDDDINPELYWDEVRLESPEPIPNLKVDTKVIVWSDPHSRHERYFSHFDECGKMLCFADGETSRSNKGRVTQWDYWKLVD